MFSGLFSLIFYTHISVWWSETIEYRSCCCFERVFFFYHHLPSEKNPRTMVQKISFLFFLLIFQLNFIPKAAKYSGRKYQIIAFSSTNNLYTKITMVRKWTVMMGCSTRLLYHQNRMIKSDRVYVKTDCDSLVTDDDRFSFILLKQRRSFFDHQWSYKADWLWSKRTLYVRNRNSRQNNFRDCLPLDLLSWFQTHLSTSQSPWNSSSIVEDWWKLSVIITTFRPLLDHNKPVFWVDWWEKKDYESVPQRGSKGYKQDRFPLKSNSINGQLNYNISLLLWPLQLY